MTDALELFVVIRWGTSVLETRRITPPKTFTAETARARVTIEVEVDRQGVIRLRGEGIEVGEARQLHVGELTLEIAFARTENAEVGKPPFDRPALASQMASLLLHAAMIASLATLAPPMEGEEDIELEREAVASLTSHPSSETSSSAELDQADPSVRGGAEEGMRSHGGESAKRGLQAAASQWAPPARAHAREHEPGSDLPTIDAKTFGIINLISVASSEPHRGGWGDLPMGGEAPTRASNMWGPEVGDALGAGGLGLSGVGESGGGIGRGVGLGSLGLGRGTIGSCDAQCMAAKRLGQGASIESRIGNRHRPVSIDICGVSGTAEGAPHEVNACHRHVSGRLPPEVVQRVVRQSFGRFRHCYEQGLRPQPSLVGRVTVRFVIGRDGTVSSVQDGGSDLPNTDVVACVVRAFGGLSFPQPEGGIVSVVYPITFSPGG